MWTPRMPFEPANVRCTAEVTSGNASPGAVAYSWSPTRATVDDVPIALGLVAYHGADRERLIVKVFPGFGRNQVPVPLLPAGSGPNGQLGPWLHAIAMSRLLFSAALEYDCVAAASVVSLMQWALVMARMTWLVMKRPCSATSSYVDAAPMDS